MVLQLSSHRSIASIRREALEVPREPEPPACCRPERVMTVKTLFERLHSELDSLAPVYARLHLEYPVLAPHPTLHGLIERLTAEARHDRDARSLLICALLDAHRRAPHRLWAAILLRVFRPMLRSTYKQLFGSDREERLSLLVVSFHEAIVRVDPYRDPVRIGMYVRQATRKAVFAELADELDWTKTGFGADADDQPDPRTVDEPPVAAGWLRGRGLPRGAHVDLVHTIGHRGALWAFVRGTYASMTEEQQASMYSRLRDRRRSLLAKMRGRLKRTCLESSRRSVNRSVAEKNDVTRNENPSDSPRRDPLHPTCPDPLRHTKSAQSTTSYPPKRNPCPTRSA
jgi:hypothetical protein